MTLGKYEGIASESRTQPHTRGLIEAGSSTEPEVELLFSGLNGRIP